MDYGGITTTIKHAMKLTIKLKTSPGPARWYAVVGCNLQQNANEGCKSCASLAGLVLSLIAVQLLVVAAVILSFKFYRKFYCMFYCSCDPSISV